MTSTSAHAVPWHALVQLHREVMRRAGHESPDTQPICRDYDRLERHLGAAPHDVGGLGLLERTSGAIAQATRELVPIFPLNDTQRRAVETVLARHPVTIIEGRSGWGRKHVILSILLNAWAGGTSVLLTSGDRATLDAVRQRLEALDSDVDIAIGAGGRRIDEALARTFELISARRSESFYGGSPTARKRSQLVKKKQLMHEMLDNQVPQRVSQAMRTALESCAAAQKARSELESRREQLACELRDLGVGDDPDSFEERILAPLRKWRAGIDTTHRLIEEDAQRVAALQKELSAARAERDSALSDYPVDASSDEGSSWLLAEPGFKSFEQAFAALSDKLRDPIEDHFSDVGWDRAYDAWSSSTEATEWERKARETASIIRPASITLKEKTEEVHAAREALDAAERSVQTATKASSLDARREDLDEWAACYAELCALPRSKLAFLGRSKDTELLRRLEEIESRFRSTFPPHLWSSIGKLDESGRARLSPVIERAREWFDAREAWDRLGAVREEIEAQADALRDRLVALGLRDLSAEVSPSGCAAVASDLNTKASQAASASEAWLKRETRERLPGELMELAAQIRAAGAGTPIKERWINGAGGALMAALDAVASDPGTDSIKAVRRELLESAEMESVLQSWRRAYEAQSELMEIGEEIERIPPRAARVSHWKTRRPASLPAELDVADAFDGDDSHPAWALLSACEGWRQRWLDFRDTAAHELERAAATESATAVARIEEAAHAVPPGKERAWLESLASAAKRGEPWPVEEITERAALWRPERLQTEIERIDAQLERITFETAKERWLERVVRDAEGLQSLGALRDHCERNSQHIEDDGYAHFERSLKIQPVWVSSPASAQFLPLKPGLFDLLIIDDAASCTFTEMLPLIFRAKRLVVAGDPEQAPAADSVGVETEQALAARLGIESWVELFGHVGNNAHKVAVGNLPGRRVEVISLVEDE